MDQLKALEIEPRRFGLVVKDPRPPKRVDFIAVTGLGLLASRGRVSVCLVFVISCRYALRRS